MFLFIDPEGTSEPFPPFHISDQRCLPQNFVPAVTAPIPLTAVQVTDADLLEFRKTVGLADVTQRGKSPH